MFTVQQFDWINGILQMSTKQFEDREQALNYATLSTASSVRVVDKKKRVVFHKRYAKPVQSPTTENYA